MDIKAIASVAAARTPVPGNASPAAPAAINGTTTNDRGADSGGRSGETPATGVYISPVLRYDVLAKLPVLFFRDSDTGEIRDQIPPERVVERYRKAGGRDRAYADDGTGDPSVEVVGDERRTDVGALPAETPPALRPPPSSPMSPAFVPSMPPPPAGGPPGMGGGAGAAPPSGDGGRVSVTV